MQQQGLCFFSVEQNKKKHENCFLSLINKLEAPLCGNAFWWKFKNMLSGVSAFSSIYLSQQLKKAESKFVKL